MKHLKKLLVVVAALAMAMALSAVAWAADNAGYHISLNSDDTHTYKVYQVLTGDLSADGKTGVLIELNAETGNVNTVDVHPVSADITQAVGLLAARDTALRMAELTDRDPVEFTKAKIDRSSGSYVYELEFETPDYEYEVSIRTETGEVLKYRVWQQ